MVVNFTTWQFSVFYGKERNKWCFFLSLFIYRHVDRVSAYTIDQHLTEGYTNYTRSRSGAHLLTRSKFFNLGWLSISFVSKPWWGTKVLRHFRKMAPFSIVDIPIPFPCLPQPLPPKINVVFWALKSFFYFRQHWFGGSGDLRCLKGLK